MLLALTVKYDYEVEQMNVVIAFLEAQKKKSECSNRRGLNRKDQMERF